MVLILLNFLLAIICDAFGEVKGAASESTSVLEEVGPMLVEMWRSVADKSYISDATILRQLKARGVTGARGGAGALVSRVAAPACDTRMLLS